jgi:hypothetical protein
MEGGLCRSGGTSPARKLAATVIGWKPRAAAWPGQPLTKPSERKGRQGSNPAANRRVSASGDRTGDRTRSHVFTRSAPLTRRDALKPVPARVDALQWSRQHTLIRMVIDDSPSRERRLQALSIRSPRQGSSAGTRPNQEQQRCVGSGDCVDLLSHSGPVRIAQPVEALHVQQEVEVRADVRNPQSRHIAFFECHVNTCLFRAISRSINSPRHDIDSNDLPASFGQSHRPSARAASKIKR